MEISGGGLAQMIKTGMDSMAGQAEELKNQMGKISELDSSEDKQTALLEIQFEMGQYNAIIELTSNLVKSLSDSIKSVAQKAG